MHELEIQKEIDPIIQAATSLTIIDTSSLTDATRMLSQLNTYGDKITEEKEKVTKPLNQALKAERSRWKPIEETLSTAIDLIRSKLSDYQTEAITAQTQAENLAIEHLNANPEHISQALDSLSAIPSPESKITTEDGTLTFRPTPTLKVNDLSSIPEAYFDLNESRVLEDLKAGVIVPGAIIEIVQIPVNRRK